MSGKSGDVTRLSSASSYSSTCQSPTPHSPTSRMKAFASAISWASYADHEPPARSLVGAKNTRDSESLDGGFEPLRQSLFRRVITEKPAPHSTLRVRVGEHVGGNSRRLRGIPCHGVVSFPALQRWNHLGSAPRRLRQPNSNHSRDGTYLRPNELVEIECQATLDCRPAAMSAAIVAPICARQWDCEVVVTRTDGWLQCRGEWARRLGALLPKRMVASWSGSSTDPTGAAQVLPATPGSPRIF
jgi:hypothetical protein